MPSKSPENKDILDEPTSQSRKPILNEAPLIFISHDSRDADLAEAFCRLLSSVSAGVLKSFRSSDRKGTQGMEYGVEWFPTLMEKLSSASDVVCLLTPRSLDRPWILYEAGVAKGKLETPVYGVAFGIPLGKASTGPFAQFQNSDDEVESLTKLVLQLLSRIPGAEPDEEAVQMQVQSFKGKVEGILQKSAVKKSSKITKPEVDGASVSKLFEEVKVMFQDLPERLEGRLSAGASSKRKRLRRKFHPTMVEDLLMMAEHEDEDPVGLLLVAGVLREDAPWISEVLAQTYQQVRSGDSLAASRLRRTLNGLCRGPFVELLGTGTKESYMIIRDLPMMMDRYLMRLGGRDNRNRLNRERLEEKEGEA